MIFTRAKKSDAAYGAGRQTERTDYSSMDESKRYVSDKDGNPVSYDELIMRSRMAHEALFVEVMKTASPEMREAVANIEAVLAGKMDQGFRYRDLSAEEVAFFMERTGVDFEGYEWRIIPGALLHENTRTDEKRGWLLTDTELKLLPHFIDSILDNRDTLAVSLGEVNAKGVRSFMVEVENPITKAKMVFEASSKKHTSRPYKTKKAPRLSLSSAKMLLIQRAGLPPARPPHSVPSGEATVAENAGEVKQNLLKQEFSSRDTSINSTRPPAVYVVAGDNRRQKRDTARDAAEDNLLKRDYKKGERAGVSPDFVLEEFHSHRDCKSGYCFYQAKLCS